MRISYYNLDKDDFNKKHSRFKKKKLFTICFNHILEDIQFENSDRGLLLWVNTPKTIRVFGYWKQGGCGEVRNSIRLGLTTIVAVDRVTKKRREYERI